MWHPIGLAIVQPWDREVTVGRFAGVLPDGVLILRAAYQGPGSPDIFSFCIFDFLDDDGTRPLGSERWWPRPQPSVVRLGPGITSEVAGTVLLRPRSYNRSWLSVGIPSITMPVAVSAWLSDGSSSPGFVPSGFTDGVRFLDLTGDAVGPGGAYPVGPIGG